MRKSRKQNAFRFKLGGDAAADIFDLAHGNHGLLPRAFAQSISHFPVPVLRALLDDLDLRRRQIEQGVHTLIELRLQPDDLGGALLVPGATGPQAAGRSGMTSLHNGDLVVAQPVQFVHQRVDLFVRGLRLRRGAGARS